MNYTREAKDLFSQIHMKETKGMSPDEIVAFINQYLENLVEDFHNTIEIDPNEMGYRGDN